MQKRFELLETKVSKYLTEPPMKRLLKQLNELQEKNVDSVISIENPISYDPAADSWYLVVSLLEKEAR